MNRKPLLCLCTLILLLVTVACGTKDADIPVPIEAPEVPKIEKPAEEVKDTPPPVVETVPEPDPLDNFDVNDHPLDDVYFEFDEFSLTEETKAALRRYAEVLKANEGLQVLIEGHCDERGTEDYNLALGEKRAIRVKEYLVSLGYSDRHLKTISYGETQPKVDESSEEAWAKNRRAHFLVSKPR